MTYNYGAEYYRRKSKEMYDRDKERGITKFSVRARNEHKKMISKIVRLMREGHKIEFRINNGDWQGEELPIVAQTRTSATLPVANSIGHGVKNDTSNNIS